jgi:hypothetical protein
MLVSRKIAVVESKFAACNHSGSNLLVLVQPINELLEGEAALVDGHFVVASPIFWNALNRTLHDRIEIRRLVFLHFIGLTE